MRLSQSCCNRAVQKAIRARISVRSVVALREMRQMIIPAPTVLLVDSSMTMKAPVARLVA